MARLRFNGLASGSAGSLSDPALSGSHNSSTTTFTFAAALTFANGTAVPTIASPDYMALTVLDANGHVAEIVKVTAYASGATTATVVRGQEGTSGVSHASGAKVDHAPTAHDFPKSIIKAADTARTSTTTLADDPHLTLPIGANESWEYTFELHIGQAGSNSPDFKSSISAPSGSTVRAAIDGLLIAATDNEGAKRVYSVSGASVLSVGLYTSAPAFVRVVATVENGSTAGNVTLQWAQNTSDGTAVTVLRGSVMRAVRL